MTPVIAVDIPMAIASQNSFMYKHWRHYNRYMHEWQSAISHFIGRPAAHCAAKRRCQIISQRGRLLDMGNLVGGAKPIPDILQRLGWIVDDSPKWFTCAYEQEQVKGATRKPVTTIRLWDDVET